MTKDRITMEVVIVRVETIFHINNVMTNPILSLAAMIIQDISSIRTEAGETVAGMMMMAATVITKTLTVEVIFSGLLATHYPYKTPASKFSMAILGISHYNAPVVDSTPHKRETSTVSFHVIQHFSEIPFAFLFKIARHDLQSNIFH